MNFYEHQDRARRRTSLLVFLVVLAVLLIVLAIYFPIAAALASQMPDTAWWWNPSALVAVTIVCLLIVGIAGGNKLRQLRGGGSAVAEMLGGTPMDMTVASGKQRRARNVVEEMALASGMPVPLIYIIDDDSINAFAAGWSPGNAVVGLTRGCIEQLNREQLQGVVAHEFSHISHGDMRINIRLIGVIFGIMGLGVVGWLLVRHIGPAILRSSRYSRSRDKGGAGGVGLAIILIGLLMVICGAIGTFFGRLIQAAVSRQREYLADASAVQYTRNPDGIGGALREISGMKTSASLPSDASQCNHMFFVQALGALFASHPPIRDRVSRIEGIDVASLPPVSSGHGDVRSGVAGFAATAVQKTIDNAGEILVPSREWGEQLRASIPTPIAAAVQVAWSARLAVWSLVLSEDEDAQAVQWAALAGVLSADELSALRELHSSRNDLPREARIQVLDLAAPSLRSMSQEQRAQFSEVLHTLVAADDRVDRFEWVVVVILRRHLAASTGKKDDPAATATLRRQSEAAVLVLATLALCGGSGRQATRSAFAEGLRISGLSDTQMPPPHRCTMRRLERALQDLRRLRFRDRRLLLLGGLACVQHDNTVDVDEAEMLRAIADVLDCPLPAIEQSGEVA
jgi:Zn-dependent protease with chaperone function/uncharacterized tellurite resistance protein B-like protein